MNFKFIESLKISLIKLIVERVRSIGIYAHLQLKYAMQNDFVSERPHNTLVSCVCNCLSAPSQPCLIIKVWIQHDYSSLG